MLTKELTWDQTIALAATTIADHQIPADSLLLGLSGRVTTALTTSTDMDFGDGSTVDLFATAVGVTVDSVFPGFKNAPTPYTAANNIVITPTGTPTGTPGVVKMTMIWQEFPPPAA